MIQTRVVSFYQERGNNVLLNYRISAYKTRGIIFLLDLQLQVIIEISKLYQDRSVHGAGIIRNAGIIRRRALPEEIRHSNKYVYNLGFSIAS